MNLPGQPIDLLDRKKLAAFSALGGGFLRFPIGDRRCNRTRASVGNAGGNARPGLTNATLAASRLPHRRSPTASPRARPKKVGAFSALGRGDAAQVMARLDRLEKQAKPAPIGEHRMSGEKKYYLANLPANTDLRTLAAAIKARWICEQAHQQMKEELGLDHFESGNARESGR